MSKPITLSAEEVAFAITLQKAIREAMDRAVTDMTAGSREDAVEAILPGFKIMQRTTAQAAWYLGANTAIATMDALFERMEESMRGDRERSPWSRIAATVRQSINGIRAELSEEFLDERQACAEELEKLGKTLFGGKSS